MKTSSRGRPRSAPASPGAKAAQHGAATGASVTRDHSSSALQLAGAARRPAPRSPRRSGRRRTPPGPGTRSRRPGPRARAAALQHREPARPPSAGGSARPRGQRAALAAGSGGAGRRRAATTAPAATPPRQRRSAPATAPRRGCEPRCAGRDLARGTPPSRAAAARATSAPRGQRQARAGLRPAAPRHVGAVLEMRAARTTGPPRRVRRAASLRQVIVRTALIPRALRPSASSLASGCASAWNRFAFTVPTLEPRMPATSSCVRSW